MVSEHLKLGNLTFPQPEDPLQHPYHSPRPAYELEFSTCHPRLQDIRHLWKDLVEAYPKTCPFVPKSCSMRSNRASKIDPTGAESCGLTYSNLKRNPREANTYPVSAFAARLDGVGVREGVHGQARLRHLLQQVNRRLRRSGVDINTKESATAGKRD